MSGKILDRVSAVATGSSKVVMGRWKCLVMVGIVAALAACGNETETSGDGMGPDMEVFRNRIETLATAVERAEGVRAVKRLQWAYGHYSELGLWNDFADLFAEDAVGHYTTGALNRDEIRDLFVNQVGEGRLGLADGRIYPHISFSPVINILPDGESAKARFRIIAMLGGYGSGATWFHGLYNNEYSKADGVWAFKEITFQGQAMGPYDKGLRPAVSAPLDEPTSPFHYDPREAGQPILHGTVSGPALPADFASLTSAFGDLRTRIAVLNAEAAVTNLQHAYGYYVDRRLWDDVADLFADNGTMELGQRGVYAGKTSIRRALDQFGPAGLRAGDMNDHIQFQTYVSIAPDGRTAKARGVQLIATGGDDGTAKWHQGIYENDYVLDDGVWKIRSVHYYPRLITDYDKGWARDAQAAPGPSAQFPPDRPSTEVYENYPAFHIAPFHFLHPVTGRPPHYPDGSPAAGAPIGFTGGIALDAVPGSPEDLEAQLAAAEQAMLRVEAYDGAENVLDAYGFYLDEHMWGAAAALFAADGANEIPGVGAYVGRERIRQALETAYGAGGRRDGVLDLHHLIQPVITVAEDGQSARVRMRLWRVHAEAEGDAWYLAGIYEGAVVSEDDTWKISGLTLDYTWAAPYMGGWARVEGGEPLGYAPPADMAATFPPDRPARGVALAPFPRIEQLPFHYANPVSARAPAILTK